MGYVERNAGGWTELRVHGVAGTAPESVLEHPHAAQVAGNEDAGFLRRLWEARSVSADTPRRRREAYSWGGLTSGDNTRALWLLLLPFMLLNVAFYMTPYRRPPGSTDRTDRRRDRAAAAVQRVLALSFTVTFTLTTIGVAMDLVGWQCAAGRPQGADVCGTSWLSWLSWAWLDQPGRQVAVTALAPLAVAGLLWGLAGSTWNRMESVEITQERPGYETEICTPLEDRAMWNGRATVRRLRAVHVATAVTLPGVFALATLGWRTAWPLLVPQLVLLAVMLILVIAPGAWSRRTPAADSAANPEQKQRQRAGEQRDRYHWMPRIALVLTGAALVAVWVGDTVEPVGTLPWLVMTVQGLFVAQALALLVLLVICVRLAARAAEVRGDGPPAGAPDPADRPVDPRPAWRGLAMPAVAMLAWVLAGGFSAGVVLRTAQTLGTPVARGQRSGEPYPLVVPTAYQWVAVAALALGVVAVLVGVVAWWRLGRSTAMAPTVEQAYGAAARANPERRDEIARAWARATALRAEVERALGVLLVLTVVVLVAGVVGFMSYGPRLLSEASPLVAVASLALTGFVVGLLAVGRQAYRNPATRRSVGIIWDLGTFWPRAVHPLAPPCYAERALPDLMRRLRHLTMGGRVLLSCHSQGSVLGAALLLQIERPASARTALLTYGAPLARIYARFFPVYFSREALTRLGLFLSDDPADHTGRTAWRWRNLHRPSDPIGGAVFVDRLPVFPRAAHPGADPGDVDRPLLDPVFPRAAGDPCYPRIRGHSRYFTDPAFGWTADALQRGTLPRPAGARAAPGTVSRGGDGARGRA